MGNIHRETSLHCKQDYRSTAKGDNSPKAYGLLCNLLAPPQLGQRCQGYSTNNAELFKP